MFYFFRTLLNETHITNIRFTKSARTSICCPKLYFSLHIPNEFALLISLGINSHILGASEDMLSVPKYTVRFLRLYSSGSFLKLYGFCIKRLQIQKNVGNQGGDAGNQGWNLSIAVEMRYNSNKNDNFKDWREVKIIENENISKNLILHIWFGVFLVNFEHILYIVFLFLLLILNR